jgi:hypothetical protein
VLLLSVPCPRRRSPPAILLFAPSLCPTARALCARALSLHTRDLALYACAYAHDCPRPPSRCPRSRPWSHCPRPRPRSHCPRPRPSSCCPHHTHTIALHVQTLVLCACTYALTVHALALAFRACTRALALRACPRVLAVRASHAPLAVSRTPLCIRYAHHPPPPPQSSAACLSLTPSGLQRSAARLASGLHPLCFRPCIGGVDSRARRAVRSLCPASGAHTTRRFHRISHSGHVGLAAPSSNYRHAFVQRPAHVWRLHPPRALLHVRRVARQPTLSEPQSAHASFAASAVNHTRNATPHGADACRAAHRKLAALLLSPAHITRHPRRPAHPSSYYSALWPSAARPAPATHLTRAERARSPAISPRRFTRLPSCMLSAPCIRCVPYPLLLPRCARLPPAPCLPCIVVFCSRCSAPSTRRVQSGPKCIGLFTSTRLSALISTSLGGP